MLSWEFTNKSQNADVSSVRALQQSVDNSILIHIQSRSQARGSASNLNEAYFRVVDYITHWAL